VAHFGVAVALLGMASESAFTEERLAALSPGEKVIVRGWIVTLESVTPTAGPNWSALEAQLAASYDGAEPDILRPQARVFSEPVQETTESALETRWNGQLYAVLGNPTDDGRWQIRLWWKPFVTLIWYGGLLIALGGLLAMFGHILKHVKRTELRRQIGIRKGQEAQT